MTGIVEHGADVTKAAFKAMDPISIGFLMMNLAFIGFCVYILGEVAESGRLRNQTQMDLISKLVSDIRDCRSGPPGRGDLDHLLPRLGQTD